MHWMHGWKKLNRELEEAHCGLVGNKKGEREDVIL